MRAEAIHPTFTSQATSQSSAEETLARQVRYERALAGCSQTLLGQAEDDQARQKILNGALTALLEAACVSRIGLFAMGDDATLGLTSQLAAEATAPGFPSRLEELRAPVPAADWTTFNERMRSGEVMHGRLRDIFADKPGALEGLDVRSVLFCPVHLGEAWWGYLAYGDATEERAWEEDEVRLIRTASQMFAGTLQRWQAEATLRRQYRIQLALSRCSRALLAAEADHDSQLAALSTALAHLLEGAGAHRAYLFRNFVDAELGECFGMVAEAVAPGVDRHILNPANWRAPWSRFPTEQRLALEAKRPFAGPVERLFASTPYWLEVFRRNRLRSVLMVPIHMGTSWWGFIGFDAQDTPREWDEHETMLLQTAAEMVGNVMQRWALEAELEQRVTMRTAELAQANRQLSREIVERQRAEEEAKRRLAQEHILATISARLLQDSDHQSAIAHTLQQLGQILLAERSILFWFNPDDDLKPRIFDWHVSQRTDLRPDFYRLLSSSFGWARAELDAGRIVFCSHPARLPADAHAERSYLEENAIASLLIVPVQAEGRLLGALAYTDLAVDSRRLDDVRITQVVAGMLGNLLQRQELLESMEERVAARTAEVMAFQDITVLAREARPLADILQPALQKVMDVSACSAVTIHLLAAGGESLELAVHAGVPANALTARFRQLARPSWCSTAGNPVIIQDLSEETDRPEVPRISGHTAYAGAVLQAQDSVNGLLGCYWTTPAHLSVDMLAILVVLAEQLGIVVENHRLREQVEEIAATQERQRLAQELHDVVAQTLYGLSLFARAGKDALQHDDSAKLERSLDYMDENARQALKEMRLLLFQLRPPIMNGTAGFVEALNHRFDEVERRLGVQASVEVKAALPPCEFKQGEIYRIVVEALNNSLRHASASQVHVGVRSANGGVEVTVRDNGSGFDTAGKLAGMGLGSMQQRAGTLQGRLVINSRPGEGTEVCLWVPDNAAGEAA